MEFSTEWTTINLDILESVLYNAESAIPKLKIELEFEDQEKYNKFMSKYHPTANDEDDIIDSDPESEEIDEEEAGEDERTVDPEEAKHVELLPKIELSIVLKQFYQKQIEEIGKKTNVRILIVPKKIKYFARDRMDIDDAIQGIYQVRQNINIYSINNYGLELMESRHYKQLLAEDGIHIGKKAQTYYYWYDQSKITSATAVSDKVEQVFFKGIHKFYPLNMEINPLLSEPYLDLITAINGQLFDSKLSKKMNEDYPIEISQSGRDLIIHCQVEEQAAIPEHELKKLFQNIVYFFINYEGQDDEEAENEEINIANIDKIEQMLTNSGINWRRRKELLVVAYLKKTDQSSGDQVADNSDKKQFLSTMEEVFALNIHCMIEIPDTHDTNLEKDGVEHGTKKYTVQYRKFEHIWGLAPKNRKSTVLTDIIDKHVLTPVLERKNRKDFESPKKVDVSLTSYKDSQINDTSFQRTFVVEEGLSISVAKKQKTEQYLNNSGNADFILPAEIQKKYSEKLNNYKFKIDDHLGKQKYSDQTNKIQKRKKSQLNTELDEYLRETTNQKFRSSDVLIPIDYERILEAKAEDCIVTIFASKDEQEKFYKEPIKVRLVEKWSHGIGNGWLLNIPRSEIKEEGGSLLVESVNFEVVKNLRFVKS